MSEISKAPIARLLSQAGGDRISAEAVDEMVKYTEEYVLKVGAEASKLCVHAGRKTVKADDIKLAAERLNL
jgi:histone H3/H4